MFKYHSHFSLMLMCTGVRHVDNWLILLSQCHSLQTVLWRTFYIVINSWFAAIYLVICFVLYISIASIYAVVLFTIWTVSWFDIKKFFPEIFFINAETVNTLYYYRILYVSYFIIYRMCNCSQISKPIIYKVLIVKWHNTNRLNTQSTNWLKLQKRVEIRSNFQCT